jgi:hypothetical protein
MVVGYKPTLPVDGFLPPHIYTSEEDEVGPCYVRGDMLKDY